MKICGIIAEYNPFHNGHARHIAETRRILGADTAVVCIMSGNYVQRGDLAVMEKYRRAEAAVCAGADLVLEMPLAACLSSAEGFAHGGVSLLDALGGVTHLSFGSEAGEIDPLRHAARLRESAAVKDALRRALRQGLPYAAAMQHAVSGADAQAGALYAAPNNTLGIAYCAALDAQNSRIEPLTILREGAAHDAHDAPNQLPSASYLRTLLAASQTESCRPLMPAAAFSVLARALEENAAPVWSSRMDPALVAHLRRLSPEDLAHYCGGGDGLEHRLWAAIRDHISFAQICTAAQTRRYPLARVRRALLRAWLDLPAEWQVTAEYVRVLAIGASGRAILRRMKKTCALPVILKPVTEQRLPEALQPSLRRDALADDLYALALPAPKLRVGGAHFRKTPFLLP